MRPNTLSLGLAALLLGCSPSSERGPAGAPVGSASVAASAPASQPEDASVFGTYFQFLRPPPNLVLRRAPKEPGKEEPPPPLTGKHLGAVYDLVEFSLQTQLTEAQKKILRDAVVAEYDSGGERRDGILSSPLVWASMEMFYKNALQQGSGDEMKKMTPREFFTANRKDFVEGVAKSPDGYPYKAALTSIIKSCDTQVVPGESLTQQQLASLVEAFEFLGAVYLGKPLTLLAEDREALTTGIVAAFQGLPPEMRAIYAAQDKAPEVLWTLLRANWTLMDRPQRETFRADLVRVFGVPAAREDLLTPEALAELQRDAKFGEVLGAKFLLSLPEDKLSGVMRELLLSKAPILLEQLRELPTPQGEMLGLLIYDY